MIVKVCKTELEDKGQVHRTTMYEGDCIEIVHRDGVPGKGVGLLVDDTVCISLTKDIQDRMKSDPELPYHTYIYVYLMDSDGKTIDTIYNYKPEDILD